MVKMPITKNNFRLIIRRAFGYIKATHNFLIYTNFQMHETLKIKQNSNLLAANTNKIFFQQNFCCF